uniref:Uncharacterized protein n=1 Tax=Romanomermis culicivorax TaxID=13658 RepID=A0A915K8M4_ROMCU
MRKFLAKRVQEDKVFMDSSQDSNRDISSPCSSTSSTYGARSLDVSAKNDDNKSAKIDISNGNDKLMPISFFPRNIAVKKTTAFFVQDILKMDDYCKEAMTDGLGNEENNDDGANLHKNSSHVAGKAN